MQPKIRHVESWEEAKNELRLIEEEANELRQTQELKGSNEFFFRGHSDASWKLDTTLDRVLEEPISVRQYYFTLLKIRDEVEAFSSNRWDLFDKEKFKTWIESKTSNNLYDFPGYEFMVYLRHHGFPSPLLDWTKSFYVAAFFAFRPPPKGENPVAIYCFLKTLGKLWSINNPSISVLGPHVRSHRRHFLQQCCYSVCSEYREEGTERLFYVNHENGFYGDSTQNFIRKIVIPNTAREEALRDLYSMNVHALSLMNSEDSLIEMLANRVYVLGG